METKAKNIVIWLVLLLVGLAMIVGPVAAYNRSLKALDSKVPITNKITNEDKDKNVKDLDKDKSVKDSDKDKKDNDDNSIRIKSYPVLKSPT